MSDYVKAGGAAFPVPSYVDAEGYTVQPEPGMSLRDWFAGQALAGLLADHVTDYPPPAVADISYAIADAMLAKRAKR